MKALSVSAVMMSAMVALSGCSGGDTPSAQAASKPRAAQALPDDPIAAVAYDFMDAVFANDIARATQRLTPQAIENLQAQDKRFEWGATAAKLEIGQVRVENDEAAVECLVTAEAGIEELLCVLRKVGGQWRVYGVAWQGDEGGEPQVVNFEELPPSTPSQQPRPQNGNRYVESPAPQIPALPAAQPDSPSVAEQPSALVR